MAKNVKLNIRGFVALRKSIDDELMDRAQRIVRACGEGYEAEHAPSRNRARVTVFANTDEAFKDNVQHQTLLKNIGKAR